MLKLPTPVSLAREESNDKKGLTEDYKNKNESDGVSSKLCTTAELFCNLLTVFIINMDANKITTPKLAAWS
jgi:hypothetical protein